MTKFVVVTLFAAHDAQTAFRWAIQVALVDRDFFARRSRRRAGNEFHHFAVGAHRRIGWVATVLCNTHDNATGGGAPRLVAVVGRWNGDQGCVTGDFVGSAS